MRVLIFGATGGTGQQLVQQSLERGHEVSAFVHHSAETLGQLASRVSCIQGDVRDHESTAGSLAGQDAVLVALGVTPGRSNEVLSVGTRNIVRGMQERHVRRLVVETGAGLSEETSKLPAVWRLAAALPPMRGMFDAKREQEAAVRSSGLEWVIVRPANLTDGPLTGQYLVGDGVKLRMRSTVSRADVAHFMVGQLTDDTWQRKAVLITRK
jgi:putative NADH-flavin reductase